MCWKLDMGDASGNMRKVVNPPRSTTVACVNTSPVLLLSYQRPKRHSNATFRSAKATWIGSDYASLISCLSEDKAQSGLGNSTGSLGSTSTLHQTPQSYLTFRWGAWSTVTSHVSGSGNVPHADGILHCVPPAYVEQSAL